MKSPIDATEVRYARPASCADGGKSVRLKQPYLRRRFTIASGSVRVTSAS